MAFPKILQKLFQSDGAGPKLRTDIIPVDSALSATSTNAVQNKVIKSALDALASVDSALSATSTNAVQNKVIKSALDAKAPLASPNFSGTPKVGGVELVPIANNAGAHNSLYRGIDLTTKYTEAQISAKIQAGDFSDLFIGDYIPKTINISGVGEVTSNWTIAHFNYYNRMGWTADGLAEGFQVNTPHVVLVPHNTLYQAKMNDTNTTKNGYLGSKMWTTEIPKVATAIKNAFGTAQVISFASLLGNTMTASTTSMAGGGTTGATNAWGWAWTKCDCNLMSEPMVYGGMICSSSFSDVGERKTQFRLFSLNPESINLRAGWWLSAVAYSGDFADVGRRGNAGTDDASDALGVRPYFLYH